MSHARGGPFLNKLILERVPGARMIQYHGHLKDLPREYSHLITNAETIFRVGQQEKHLPVGEIIEVNNKRNHAVRNDGESDRILLIFECYNMDDYCKPG